MLVNAPLESRMAELEDLFAEFLRAQARAQAQVEQTSREMREFKAEMREFKVEMRAFKNESNKRWGELAQRLGTLAEDLVAPSVPRILRQTINCAEEPDSAVRVRRRHSTDRSRRHEFDVVAVCGDFVLINETKSRLAADDVDDFTSLLQQARAFFPEHADKKIIGALASLTVDESVVRHGEKAGLLMLGLGEELMDLLNSPGFKPRQF